MGTVVILLFRGVTFESVEVAPSRTIAVAPTRSTTTAAAALSRVKRERASTGDISARADAMC